MARQFITEDGEPVRMESYTSMSNEGIEAVVKKFQASSEPRFPIELSKSDFEGLMYALQAAHDYAEDEPTQDWAGSFASSIAETLGVEFI